MKKNPEEEIKEEQTEQEERNCSDKNEKKETTITGECIFCHTFREVPYHLTSANAQMRGITEQEAADRLATDVCNCKQGLEFRKRRERLENAAGYLKKIFKDNESAAQMSMCAIKAVDEFAVDKVTFKIAKYSYTIDKDKDNMLRVKTKFTDSNDETF